MPQLSAAKKYFVLTLACILLWATFTRFFQLSQPKNYIFDEVYHVITAKLIAHNDVRAFEWWNEPVEPNTAVDWLHPPLAKYTQAASMLVFGENAFGWRFSSAVTGVLVVLATALLARQVFKSDWVGLVAAFLASMDGLLLVQSRIAMNDIHVTLGILVALIWYWQYRQTNQWQRLLLTGIGLGLAVGSKWSGVFALLLVGAWELARITSWWRQPSAWLQRAAFIVILPMVLYLSSYWQMFAQGKSLACFGNQVSSGQCYCEQTPSGWVTAAAAILPGSEDEWSQLESRGGCKRLLSHFGELHHQIWWYQTNLKATHNYQSRPWQWFLNIRPVWFHVEHSTPNQVLNIYTQGNPWLFWSGAAVVVGLVALVGSELATNRRALMTPERQQLLFILSAYLVVWMPWVFSPRIMFFYHYTPAVPLLCILLAFVLNRVRRLSQQPRHGWLRYALFGYLCSVGIVFVLFFPNWVGVSVPQTWADAVYFALPSWK